MQPSDVESSSEASAQPQPEPRRRPPQRPAPDDDGERLRSLRDALWAARQGDFSVRLPTNGGQDEAFAEVAIAFNSLLAGNEGLVRELERVSRAAGSEGQVNERASLGPVTGSWAVAVSSINALIETMAFPTIEATRTLGLVA